MQEGSGSSLSVSVRPRPPSGLVPVDPGQKVKAEGPRPRRASGHVSLRRMSPSLLYRRRCSWVGGGPFPEAAGAPSLGWRWTRSGRNGLWSQPVPRSCSAHRPYFSPLLLAARPGAAANTAGYRETRDRGSGAGRATRRKEPGWPDHITAPGRGPRPCVLLASETQRQPVWTPWSHVATPPRISAKLETSGNPRKNSAHCWGPADRAQTHVGQVPVTGGLCA